MKGIYLEYNKKTKTLIINLSKAMTNKIDKMNIATIDKNNCLTVAHFRLDKNYKKGG